MHAWIEGMSLDRGLHFLYWSVVKISYHREGLTVVNKDNIISSRTNTDIPNRTFLISDKKEQSWKDMTI